MKRLFGAVILIILAMTVHAGGGSEPQAGNATTTSGGSNTTTAAQLAAALNAMNEGSARASGNTVTLTKSTAVQRNLTVPAGVTLELTGDGALWLGDNITLTVNGTVNAPDNSIGTVGEARSMTINGNGTINLIGKGRLLITNGKKITLDGVTLVGVPDNDESLVIVNGGEFVMVSGAIRGNSGGSVRTERGTFTMSGGFVEGIDPYIQWTLVPQDKMPGYFESVTYGNGRFIAVGRGVGGGGGSNMAYSTDGITWTDITDKMPNGTSFQKITFCGGKFFMYGYGAMATSTDGENWTVVVSNLRNDISAPAYGNGRYVFVTGGGLIMYSTDGITWTNAANRPSGLYQYKSVAYGNGKFIASSYHEGRRIAYSVDGVTWTAANTTVEFGNANIIFGAGKFVVSAWEGIAYSEDGFTWTYVEMVRAFRNGHSWSIAYDGSKFVAVSRGGEMDGIAYSADGVTWETFEFIAFGGTRLDEIAYGNGRFVGVGSIWDWENARGLVPNSNRIAYSNVQE